MGLRPPSPQQAGLRRTRASSAARVPVVMNTQKYDKRSSKRGGEGFKNEHHLLLTCAPASFPTPSLPNRVCAALAWKPAERSSQPTQENPRAGPRPRPSALGSASC